MALSGSFSKAVSNYRKLIGEWTATQDAASNTSTITLKTYWQADSSGAVSSNTSKTVRSTIDGTSKSDTITLGLKANQKKLLLTQTKTVTHKSDGTIDPIDLSVYIQIGFSLARTTYSSATATGTAKLPALARQSILSLDSGWRHTLGTPELAVFWNRASSNYTHKLELKAETSANDNNVNTAQTVWSKAGLTTSTVIDFSDRVLEETILKERDTAIKNDPDARYNGYMWLVLTTYNGTDVIGTNTVQGVFEVPARSTVNEGYVDAGTYTAGKAETIERLGDNSPFEMRILISAVDDYSEPFIESINYFTDYIEWTPDSTVYNSIIGSQNDSAQLYFYLESSWVGASGTRYIIRGAPTIKPITMLKSKNPPIWVKTPVLSENNSTVSSALGTTNKVFVQNLSTVRVEVSTESATGQDGNTIEKYRVLYNGVEKNSYTVTSNSATFYTYLTPTSAGSDFVVVEATDTNGVSSSISVNFDVLTYAPPTAFSSKATRQNGYTGIFDIYAGGTLSPLSINGVAKNSIQQIEVFIGKTGETLVSKGTVLVDTSRSTAGTYVSQLKKISDLVDAESDTYQVQITVTDKFRSSSVYLTIPPGIPLVFFDKKNNSVGFGKFPTTAKSIETNFIITTNQAVNAASINATGTIKTSGALYTTEGKVWIGSSAELNWESANNWIKSTHRIVDSNNKKLWTESDLEIQSGFVKTSNEANVVKQVDVTFPKPFSEVPNVVATAAVQAAQNVVALTVSNITTTGFSMFYLRKTVVSTRSNQLNWIATAKV